MAESDVIKKLNHLESILKKLAPKIENSDGSDSSTMVSYEELINPDCSKREDPRSNACGIIADRNSNPYIEELIGFSSNTTIFNSELFANLEFANFLGTSCKA
jgi:hypothetical protein